MMARSSFLILIISALILAVFPAVCFAAPAAIAHPGSSEAPNAALKCPSIYAVRYGETIYSIAARCGVSAITLTWVNGLRTTRVWPGQRLYIPTTARTSPAPQPTPSIHRAPAP